MQVSKNMVFPNSGAKIPGLLGCMNSPCISLVTSLAGLYDLHHLEETAIKSFFEPDTIVKLLKAPLF